VYFKLDTSIAVGNISPVPTYIHASPAPPSNSLSPHIVHKVAQEHNTKDIGCLEIEPVDIERNEARDLATL
jgi:hypothetical protein